MERIARQPSGPLAQPLSPLAHGNLFRPEDGQNRILRVLGIPVPRTQTAPAIPGLDRRNGRLRKSEAEEQIAACFWLLAARNGSWYLVFRFVIFAGGLVR